MNLPESSPKLFIAGIDGATFTIIEPLLAAGRLPFIAKLMDEGQWCPLHSVFPPMTIPAWTSFMTGTEPARHGCFDFTDNVLGRDRYERPLIHAGCRHGPTLWDILGERGLDQILIGLPMTYPPWPIRGCLVSGIMTPGLTSRFTFPAELGPEIVAQFPHYIFDCQWERYSEANETALLNELFHELTIRVDLARYLMARYPWDIGMLVFMGADRVQHFFWKYLDPEHPAWKNQPFPATLAHDSAIYRYYERLDASLASLAKSLPAGCSIMLMSDHGGGPMRQRVALNRFLIDQGYMTIRPARGLMAEPTALYDLLNLRRLARIQGQVAGAHIATSGIFTINGEARQVLRQHPPTRIEFRLQIPANCSFRAGISLDPFVWDKSVGGGVNFRIALQSLAAGAGEQELFAHRLDPKCCRADRGWFDFMLDLGRYAGQKVILALITETDPGETGYYCQVGWSTPRIVPTSLRSDDLVQASPGPSEIVWPATRAFAGTESELGLFLNLAGREPQGVVPRTEYAALRQELIAKLQQLKRPDSSAPLFHRVWRREEIYRGPHLDKAPDICLEFSDPAMALTSAILPNLCQDSLWRSGTHRPEGIFVWHGPDRLNESALAGLSLLDLLPLILAFFQQPPPVDLKLDGRPGNIFFQADKKRKVE
jgi:predicted AlkP superfamily phosphohydrolase/phosphomutase